jgi:N-methylhydantoinase A
MASHEGLRFAADTGGTFTDLVIEGGRLGMRFYKRPTTPDDPVVGLLDVIGAAAGDLETTTPELLSQAELFVFGTTRATNAVVTRTTARTALLTTKGHPDILLLREGGGRTSLFDYAQEYPDPYIPRSQTFEVSERIDAGGSVLVPLDETATVDLIRHLGDAAIEAVAVSLLWSIVNPAHELRIGELLDQHLPGVPYTLSHVLNPSLREYRRTSSAAIDASLKPVMSSFLASLEQNLAARGFAGRLLIMTAAGGVLDAAAVAEAPIHSIGSGPAAAPVAGRHFAQIDAGADTAIITDAGGTTFDIGLLRRGKVPWTRETIVGHATYGFMTGFPSVDVRSIGAGGGSIARVDEGGLLHVGPESAGAVPGPASYGEGGTRPTVTDACVVLGYIDPDYFLGGEMKLSAELAQKALGEIAEGLGTDLHAAAAAVLDLAIERMVSAIEGITLNQGIDPAAGPLIGGGGGAGLYAVGLARRLRSPSVIIPEVSAALSAYGALLSDLRRDYSVTHVASTDAFPLDTINQLLNELRSRCESFANGAGVMAESHEVVFSVEARYPNQVWEIDVPLRAGNFTSNGDVESLRQDFHDVHEELFAIRDEGSQVEAVTWRSSVLCHLPRPEPERASLVSQGRAASMRTAYFSSVGALDVPVRQLDSIEVDETLRGPVLIESPVTTVVVDPGASATRLESGSLSLRLDGAF